jgi:hypothetical protein
VPSLVAVRLRSPAQTTEQEPLQQERRLLRRRLPPEVRLEEVGPKPSLHLPAAFLRSMVRQQVACYVLMPSSLRDKSSAAGDRAL